mmetsp:Transcript_41765/g.124923  ORF Transcript_41765/g.124923 Transcript_41765/m.124923 type:complete len:398 (-) Transcript_41765:1362-2555(-)
MTDASSSMPVSGSKCVQRSWRRPIDVAGIRISPPDVPLSGLPPRRLSASHAARSHSHSSMSRSASVPAADAASHARDDGAPAPSLPPPAATPQPSAPARLLVTSMSSRSSAASDAEGSAISKKRRSGSLAPRRARLRAGASPIVATRDAASVPNGPLSAAFINTCTSELWPVNASGAFDGAAPAAAAAVAHGGAPFPPGVDVVLKGVLNATSAAFTASTAKAACAAAAAAVAFAVAGLSSPAQNHPWHSRSVQEKNSCDMASSAEHRIVASNVSMRDSRSTASSPAKLKRRQRRFTRAGILRRYCRHSGIGTASIDAHGGVPTTSKSACSSCCTTSQLGLATPKRSPTSGVRSMPSLTRENTGATFRFGTTDLPMYVTRCSSSPKMQPTLHMSIAEE